MLGQLDNRFVDLSWGFRKDAVGRILRFLVGDSCGSVDPAAKVRYRVRPQQHCPAITSHPPFDSIYVCPAGWARSLGQS